MVFSAGMIFTLYFLIARCLAATNPPPPLLPFPYKTKIVFGLNFVVKSARFLPAFSIICKIDKLYFLMANSSTLVICFEVIYCILKSLGFFVHPFFPKRENYF